MFPTTLPSSRRPDPLGPAPRCLALLVCAAASAACGIVTATEPEDASPPEGPPVAWTSLGLGAGAYFDYACGVTGPGSLYCWGQAPSGPSRVPVRVPLSAPVSGVAAGWTHACVLTPDGKALCWGRSGYHESETPSPPAVVLSERSFRALAAGNHFTCGVEVAGDLVCWKGALSPESTFTVPGLAISELTAGQSHACALTTDGVAWCWGENREGQLGDGTSTDRAQPVRVSGTLRFRSLAPGDYHTCGVALDGAAYCWGWNVLFTLYPPVTPSVVPVRMGGNLRFTSLASGFQFTCGIVEDGQAYCWGRNEQGELGNPTAPRSSATPVKVSGGIRFKILEAGGNNACGISTDGKAYCWGSDTEGQLGIGSVQDPESWRQFKSVPTRVLNPLP